MLSGHCDTDTVRAPRHGYGVGGDFNAMTPQERALIDLHESGVRFVLLRQPPCWETAGDVDILVQDEEAAHAALTQLGYFRYASRNSHRWYLRYDRARQRWIHLDVQTTLRYGQTEASRGFIDGLFGRVVRSEGQIPRLDPVDEGILLLLHATVDKGCLDRRYREQIFRLSADAISASAKRYSFLPKSLEDCLRWVNAVCDGTMSERSAVDAIRRSFGLAGHGQPSLMRRVVRRIARVFRGPRAIAFIGPDGAGKSTLMNPLGRVHWRAVRCRYMGPARSSEMHAVFRVTMRWLDRGRRRFSKRHPVGFVTRIAWQVACYFDFLVRLWRHAWFAGRGGVVLFDRYACDMYFRKPTRWNEWLFIRMFPRPRFAFLCVGDAEAIHRRKPDLSAEQIEQTIASYRRQLARHRIPYKEVNTTDLTADEALVQVVQDLLDNDWFRRRS